jgi:hypothetical protein
VKNCPESLPTAYTGIRKKIRIRASGSGLSKILKVLMIPGKDGSVIETDSGFHFSVRRLYCKTGYMVDSDWSKLRQ